MITGGAGGLLDRVAGRGVLADGCRAADGRRGRGGDLALDDGGHVSLEHDSRAGDGWEGGAAEGADTVRGRGEIGQLWGDVDISLVAVWLVLGADGSSHGSGHEDGAEDSG